MSHIAAITRHRRGKGAVYRGPDGRPVHDATTLARIKALAVPPAWTEVWICPDPAAALQATGRDRRGRKQYLYHADFRSRQERRKYRRLVPFGRALPALRRRIRRDLRQRGLPRDKVLAAAVRLIDLTALRVGNDAYARANRTFGVATLERRHVRVSGQRVRIVFRGKGAQLRRVEVRDRALARVVRRCRMAGSGRLFRYLGPDGEWRVIRASDVNEYVREHTDGLATAKDFRTWAGTVAAVGVLASPSTVSRRPGAVINRAVLAAAELLGDTVAVSRHSYVHPDVLAAASTTPLDGTALGRRDLHAAEAATLELLAARSGGG